MRTKKSPLCAGFFGKSTNYFVAASFLAFLDFLAFFLAGAFAGSAGAAAGAAVAAGAAGAAAAAGAAGAAANALTANKPAIRVARILLIFRCLSKRVGRLRNPETIPQRG